MRDLVEDLVDDRLGVVLCEEVDQGFFGSSLGASKKVDVAVLSLFLRQRVVLHHQAVVSPRDRPSPWDARDSSGLSPFTGTRRVLVGAHDLGIDLGIPVDVSRRFGPALDLPLEPRPRPIGRPPPITLITGLLRPVPFRHITPRRACPHPPQDSVDHPTAITPLATASRRRRRKHRLQDRPLRICQITTRHNAI